ncbi:AMP-dependent synthetase/ligase [Penicillium hordei]|uniref:AMP-dependent synthetase/ligase n=1 Tax=Penicillium hordei TaxID=40994 RepID=A0AAD6E827_9EURO|nr:AMP-dependent synthetase/ligase [Penicillium hordei]KAJ5603812.1 AMP-dependent synthetase/ligase [Penicillium hordei]
MGTGRSLVIEHAAVCTGWDTKNPPAGLKRDGPSMVFQFVTHAFAVSVIDYLGTLIQGGYLCLPSEGQLQNDMAGAIRPLGATVITMTPSIARILDPG